jgi:TonB family protein
VSIGGPAPERQKTPLELRRDEDLSRRVARGLPDAPGTVASQTPGPTPEAPETAPTPDTQVAGMVLAPQIEAPPPARAGEVSRVRPAAPTGPSAPPPAPSITGSLRRLEDRLGGGPVGVESGAGQQMGDLFFDPQGADFTAWANSFRTEVYRNWIVPQSVRFGARGHVQIEFLVERDGRISALRIVRESGTPALDRAAANALLGGRFPPLPSDFRPDQLAITVSFFYNVRAGS